MHGPGVFTDLYNKPGLVARISGNLDKEQILVYLHRSSGIFRADVCNYNYEIMLSFYAVVLTSVVS